MSYQALARKWRPKTFSEVIGQAHVVTALGNALDSGRVHHAYLFTGTRGVGKTTLARIFARALNCERGVTSEPCGECSACQGISNGNHIDLIEVDAASRTRVDDTRELLENVQYAPTTGRFKIYLIDEVHMLSGHSFNALLKTLEEPPAHVKFLLATTDPQKLPATILSRCIQFNLKSMDIQMLRDHLGGILEAESVPFEDEALRILARSADGSVRDALSLTDQAIVHGDGVVHTEPVRAMLGLIDDRFAFELLEAVCGRDGSEVLSIVSRMAERSANFRAALDDVITSLHNAALFHVDPAALEWKGVDVESASRLAALADPEMVQLLYQIALVGKRDFHLAPDGRSGFEMALLRMTVFQPDSIDAPAKTETPATVQGSGAGRISRNPRSARESGRAAGREPSRTGGGAGVGVGGDSGKESDVDQSPPRGAEQPAPDSPGANVTPLHPAQERNAVDPDVMEPDVLSTVSAVDTSGDGTAAVGDGIDWARFASSPGLRGISRELVMNMVPGEPGGDTLELVLDATSRHLYSDERLKKIERQCNDFFRRELRLSVTISELDDKARETPAMQRLREKQERQAEAERKFGGDSAVRGLMERFDAEIVPDSISPPSD